jgi:hypothetical protein
MENALVERLGRFFVGFLIEYISVAAVTAS